MQIKSQPYSEFTVKLLIANFLCQLMVVGVHHFGGIINSLAATGHPLEDHQTANAVIGFMYVLAIGFGTVLFFVLAGYLFFNGYEKDGAWARKVKSRLFSIGLPYVVWNFLASPWFTALLIPLFALFMPSVGTPRSCSFNEVFIGQYPAFYPANGPLWFLRELLLMTLASPLIYRMLKSRLAIYWVGATLGAWMLAASFCYGGIENITQAMFGFSLGGYWKVSGRQLFGFSPRQAIGAAVIIIACVLVRMEYDPAANIDLAVKCVAACVLVLALSSILAKTRFAPALATLGEASFFIYLVHCIGRSLISDNLISIFNPSSDIQIILAAFSIWAIIIMYAFAGWWILRRIAPRTLYFLTGGRVKNRSFRPVRTEG